VNITAKSRRAFAAVVLAVVALFALTVGSSLASAATWSDTAHGIKISGKLTVFKNGGSGKTCTIGESQAGIFLGSSGYWAKSSTLSVLTASCEGGGTFTFGAQGTAKGTPGAFQLTLGANVTVQQSPFGNWEQNTGVTVPFTNATESTPSRITFSKTKLGILGALPFEPISVSGTLNVTTLSGGVLTLS
jgi:hypothetical protein